MTPREHRLRRLVALREKQHDLTVVHLRGAQAELQAAEHEVSKANEAVRDVRNQGRAAAITGNTVEWLLTLAEAELTNLTVLHRKAECVRAASAVNVAAEQEATARRERRQMEVTLDRVRLQVHTASARAEQHVLDESFRMVRRPAV